MMASVAQLATLGRRAWTWWAHELVDMSPVRLRERRRNRLDAEIRLQREGWVVRHRDGRTTSLLPGNAAASAEAMAAVRGRRRQGRVLLVVPMARCFVRRSELPRSLMGQAGTILASELEAATPFHAGSAHWDWFADRSGPPRDGVPVVQVVLKRRDTEALLQVLAEQAVQPSALVVEDEDAVPRRRLPVNLLRHDRSDVVDAANLPQARRVLVAASILAALAIVPAAFSRQSATLADLDAAIADATDAVTLTPGLVRSSLMTIGDALQAKRSWPVTAVLNGLAATLPADSHLDHLFLERDVVTIQGRAASVRNLERVLGASRLFIAGHNTAPASDGADGLPFTFRLKVRPVPGVGES